MSQSQLLKANIVSDLKAKFAHAQTIIIVDYRGLTVAQISDLRRKLRENGGEILVAKNTLILKSVTAQIAKDLATVLNGPTAIVFSPDELSGPKTIAAFAKAAGLPAVKAGLVSDRVLTPSEVASLAAIPGRAVLQGKFVSLLASQPTRLVWALSGSLTKLVRTFDAVRQKKAN